MTDLWYNISLADLASFVRLSVTENLEELVVRVVQYPSSRRPSNHETVCLALLLFSSTLTHAAVVASSPATVARREL